MNEWWWWCIVACATIIMGGVSHMLLPEITMRINVMVKEDFRFSFLFAYLNTRSITIDAIHCMTTF